MSSTEKRSEIGPAAIEPLLRSPVFALAAFFTFATLQNASADPQPAAQRSGPMTAAQARAGEAVFNDYCAECHRPDLTGAFGPSLVDKTFKLHWQGKPVADLRDYVRANMPPNAPGTLREDQLDPIVAWILLRNGVHPGDRPLDGGAAKALFAP